MKFHTDIVFIHFQNKINQSVTFYDTIFKPCYAIESMLHFFPFDLCFRINILFKIQNRDWNLDISYILYSDNPFDYSSENTIFFLAYC